MKIVFSRPNGIDTMHQAGARMDETKESPTAMNGNDACRAEKGRITPFKIANGNQNKDQPDAPSLLLSIVIPVHNEVGNLELLHEEIIQVMNEHQYDYEIIFVDDGSTDGSDTLLEKLVAKNPRVKAIRFRRCYGQTAAMSAGFKYAKGQVIISMDGDLQNDPADIPRLMEKMSQGYDMVNGWRKNRKDPFFSRTLPSRIANKIINFLISGTCVYLNDYGCTLKAYKAGIVKNINLYGEMHRFIPVFAAWLGVKMVEIEVNHRERHSGTAKYNLSRVSRVILDLIVVRFFSDYGTRPIQFFGRCAKLLVQLGLAGLLLLVLLKQMIIVPVSYSALAVLFGFVLFSGLQLIFTGLLGEIIMRTYYESQSKEIYCIRDILESPDSSTQTKNESQS